MFHQSPGSRGTSGLPERSARDKTRRMPSDASPLRLQTARSVRRWLCRAIGVSAALSACGGRATDGLGPDADGPVISEPDDEEPSTVRPRRETCADNPLLAGCPYASTGGSSSVSPAEPVAPPENSPDVVPQYLAAAAENVLASNCGGCHGGALTESQASATINYIDDWDRLIQTGLIVPCSPRRSRIIQVMRNGDEPPPASGVGPVTDSDIGVVIDAIEFGCDDP